MKFLYPLIFIIFTIAFVSCAGIENIEVGEIEDIRPGRFADRSIEFDVLMPIDNPSRFRLRIVDVDLDVYINNQYMGKIRNVENVLIPSKSSEIFTFPMEVELSDILKGAFSMFNLFLDRQAEVVIKGEIRVRSFPFIRSVTVDERTRLILS